MINNITFEKQGLIKSNIPKGFIKKVLDYAVLKTIKNVSSICIIVVDDKEIKKINNKFRGKDKATTCLSFPVGMDSNFVGNNSLGDIFINIDRIKKYSQDYKYELAFNLIHSYLHLIGYSHSTDKNANIMEIKEQKLLRGFNEII
ncbi:rRNA maturation RNase YbeY [bacterium]|nr:rRNA maturation RNase YbeY [bacterium]